MLAAAVEGGRANAYVFAFAAAHKAAAIFPGRAALYLSEGIVPIFENTKQKKTIL